MGSGQAGLSGSSLHALSISDLRIGRMNEENGQSFFLGLSKHSVKCLVASLHQPVNDRCNSISWLIKAQSSSKMVVGAAEGDFHPDI